MLACQFVNALLNINRGKIGHLGAYSGYRADRSNLAPDRSIYRETHRQTVQAARSQPGHSSLPPSYTRKIDQGRSEALEHDTADMKGIFED